MPWTSFWDHNRFVAAWPVLERLLSSPYARGAASGIGVVTAFAGMLELASAFGAWRSSGPGEPKGRL